MYIQAQTLLWTLRGVQLASLRTWSWPFPTETGMHPKLCGWNLHDPCMATAMQCVTYVGNDNH